MLEGDPGSWEAIQDTLPRPEEVGTPRVQEDDSSEPSPGEGILERKDLQGRRAWHFLGAGSSMCSFIIRVTGGERGRSLMSQENRGGQITWSLVCHAKEFRLGLQAKIIQ